MLLVLIIVLWRDKIERAGPIFLHKTQEGVSWIWKTGTNHSYFFQKVGIMSIYISLVIMILVSFVLLTGAIKTFEIKEKMPPTVGLAIPGIKIPGSPIYIPLVEGLIALATVMIIHEFSHGIFASACGLRPKNLLLFILLFIPGAGVELDENKVMRASLTSRLKIYSAGSFANIVTGLLVFIMMFLFVPPIINVMTEQVNGVVITGTSPDFPAQDAGIEAGTIVKSINFTETSNFTAFANFLSNTKPNETVSLQTNKGEYSIFLAQHPDNSSKGYLGVFVDPYGIDLSPKFNNGVGTKIFTLFMFIVSIMELIVLLHINIGAINLLPLFPLDGGRMFVDIMSEKYGSKGENIAKIVSTAILFILFLNFFGAWIIKYTDKIGVNVF